MPGQLLLRFKVKICVLRVFNQVFCCQHMQQKGLDSFNNNLLISRTLKVWKGVRQREVNSNQVKFRKCLKNRFEIFARIKHSDIVFFSPSGFGVWFLPDSFVLWHTHKVSLCVHIATVIGPLC